MENKSDFNSGWSKFFAIFTLIQAIAITLVFFPLGIPMIIAGLAFLRAAKQVDKYNVDNNSAYAVKSMVEYNRGFKILGLAFLWNFIALAGLSVLGLIAYGIYMLITQ